MNGINKSRGSGRKTKHILVDNLHEIRVFFTNTKRCAQCTQKLPATHLLTNILDQRCKSA